MSKQKAPAVVEPGNDIVHVSAPEQPASAGVLGGIIQLPPWGTPLHMCPTSLDMSTRGGYAAAFNATGAATIELDKNGCAVIEAVGWLIHPVEIEREDTHEIVRVPRLVLIDRNGQTLATTSVVVMDRLAQLIAMYGPHGWEATKLEIIETKKKRGMGNYHNLRIVYEGD